MEAIGMPLLIHGEVTDPEIDIFDREAVFLERVLAPLRRDFPAPEQLRAQIRRTVMHEIAHHFGMSDDWLRDIGAY